MNRVQKATPSGLIRNAYPQSQSPRVMNGQTAVWVSTKTEWVQIKKA